MEMLSSGSGILLAVLGIGFVIAIHELGHFLFAKWAGVRVLEYAIGFGPGLWSKRIGETEYSLRLIPAGGYVAMQERADEEQPDGRSVAEAGAGWKALILLGGVLFNVISSYLLLLALAWTGMPMVPPQVGAVQPLVTNAEGELVDSPASELGLQVGDRVLSINGKPVRSFQQLGSEVVVSGNQPVTLEIERAGEHLSLPREGETVRPVTSRLQGMPTLGIAAPTSRRVAGIAGNDESELQIGDRIQAVAGESVSDLIGQELDRVLLPHLGQPVPLTVTRDGEPREVTVTYAGSSIAALADAALGLPVEVVEVMPELSAAEAGVRAGDVLRAVDGEAVRSTDHFRSLVRRRAGDGATFELELWRYRAEEGSWVPVTVAVEARWSEEYGKHLIGVSMTSLRYGVQPPPGPGLGVERNPLAEAGLQAGDAIIHIQAVEDAQRVDLHVLRGGERVLVPLDEAAQRALLQPYDPPLLFKFFGAETRRGVLPQLARTKVVALGQGPEGDRITALAPYADLEQDERIERSVGLQRLPPEVQALLVDHLQPGDWVMGFAAMPGHPAAIEVIRGIEGKPLEFQATVGDPGVAFAFAIEKQPYELDHWYEGFGLAAASGWDILDKTFRVVGALFKDREDGGVDPAKTLHGPVGIFTALKSQAESGFANFVHIVALLGLNLVIINLLPLPIADGGRLLILGIEVVMRRPLPERVVNVINLIGVVLVIMLMVFVLGLDILREMGRN